MHQLDLDTTLIHASDGFTVRLRAGSITGWMHNLPKKLEGLA